MRKIDDLSFYICRSLTNIVIPPSVRTIGDLSFQECPLLKFIHIRSTDDMDISKRDHNLSSFGKNQIILVDYYVSDKNRLEPILSIRDIHNCIESIPDNLPRRAQMSALYGCFENLFYISAKVAQYNGMNLLHILSHFPSGDSRNLIMLNLMNGLLQKCPEAAKSVDKEGHTPLYHLFASNMTRYQSVTQRLVAYSDNSVVNQAILARSFRLDVVTTIARAKIDSLSAVDEESALVAFMLAAMGEKKKNLTLTYELLKMKPDILLNWN